MIQANDIVQVKPDCPNERFRGMLVIVTEPKEWIKRSLSSVTINKTHIQ